MAEKQKQLLEAAKNGDVERVRSLLDEGVDVNARDDHDFCEPLHLAAQGGHADVVRLLLDRGADRDAGAEVRCVIVVFVEMSVRAPHEPTLRS
ncbi:hypothetical protein PINS_up008271 [Pythium insidiosum]|nr:hypothetical protein PINS_up008271 [Pythium insidiosum]